MLDFKNSYFHSLVFGEDKTLEVFEDIIKDGKILSLQRSGLVLDNKRLNKEDEICLSKKQKFSLKYDSAFDLYVRYNLSFVIKGNLPNVYKPEIISPISLMFKDLESFSDSGLTNMIDEYRVKDEISLDNVVGLTLPINSIMTNNIGYFLFFYRDDNYDKIKRKLITLDERMDRTINFYESIVKIMKDNNVDIPIYDTTSGDKIDNIQDIKIKMKKKR